MTACLLCFGLATGTFLVGGCEGMTYDEFKRVWIWALQQSGLPIMCVTPIAETLDLRSTNRTCKSFVEPFGRQDAEPFHVTAALEFTWDALQTARTNTTEEDMLQELLGPTGRRAPSCRGSVWT